MRKIGNTQVAANKVHVVTWWITAVLLSLIAIEARNNFLCLAIIALAILTHRFCSQPSPWSGALRIGLLLALFTISFRLVMAILIGVGYEADPIATLPQLRLPDWMAGLIIGGPISWSRLTAAFSSALILATVIILIGAAQTLTSPRRVLRALPNPFYEFGLVIVIATSLVPQFVESTTRIKRAFCLRGIEKPSLVQLATPIVEDCLERTLALAASMDIRGYGAERKRTSLHRERFSLLDLIILSLGVISYWLVIV